MNDRIHLILKTKNISASKFADEIGVQRSAISHILSGRNNPSLDFIQKILMRFPDINSDWILTGKGSMYTQPDLFSFPEVEKQIVKPEKVKISYPEQDMPDEIEAKTLEQEDVTVEKQPKLKTVKQQIKQTESEEKKTTDIIMKPAGKKIERIIIFYSDKSCIEYIPE
jgi:transcriptional regulator with XRE-family HTH domain